MAPNGRVLVAGHICLDIIPELRGNVAFEPGKLLEAGPATLSTGGAVSNTGLALAKLGVQTTLIGRVGSGIFGRAVLELLEARAPGSSEAMSVVEGETTSYTVVVNLSGHDRMFFHCPGANDSFGSADVSDDALSGAEWFHFGYPPLMARMYRDGGAELAELFRRAKAAGAITSLDMSLPDPDTESGRASWPLILERVMPYVDYFFPSLEEIVFMFGGTTGDVLDYVEAVESMGARNVGLKLGADGFLLRTGETRASIWQSCFKVGVLGTTGAGDAAIAGFIFGSLSGFSPKDCCRAAAAVGACCCEAPDAVSGIRPWHEVQARIDQGWATLDHAAQ